MKKIKFLNLKASLIAIICSLTFMVSSCTCNKKQGSFRHVVAFKFKEDVTQQQIDDIIAEFASLQEKIPAIVNFEGGKDVSNENLHKGYTHCFTVSFENEAGRAIYQPHPAHQAFGKNVTPLLDKVFVMDYVVE